MVIRLDDVTLVSDDTFEDKEDEEDEVIKVIN